MAGSTTGTGPYILLERGRASAANLPHPGPIGPDVGKRADKTSAAVIVTLSTGHSVPCEGWHYEFGLGFQRSLTVATLEHVREFANEPD